jgi:hypothetical protein
MPRKRWPMRKWRRTETSKGPNPESGRGETLPEGPAGLFYCRQEPGLRYQ